MGSEGGGMKLHESLKNLVGGIRHIKQVCRGGTLKEVEGLSYTESTNPELREAYWMLHQAEEILREALREVEVNGGDIEGPDVRWAYGLGEGGACSSG
jgi:hypothetical protein